MIVKLKDYIEELVGDIEDMVIVDFEDDDSSVSGIATAKESTQALEVNIKLKVIIRDGELFTDDEQPGQINFNNHGGQR